MYKKTCSIFILPLMVHILQFGSVNAIDIPKKNLISVEVGDTKTITQQCLCQESFDESVDYFPDKVIIKHALQFNITYHKYFKVILNRDSSMAYVAVMCGAPIPTDQEIKNIIHHPDIQFTIIQIPLTKVSVLSTPLIPFIELLGERQTIKAINGADYISSPCLQKLISANEIVDATPPNEWYPNKQILIDAGINGSFCTPLYDGCSHTNVHEPIHVNEYMETSPLAVVEWIKYVAAFYNREQFATEIFDNQYTRYTCAKKTAYSAIQGAKTILWGYYYEGWYAGSCPNYYCSLIKDAGGTMIVAPSFSKLNDTEFIALAANADIWFYASNNWNSVAEGPNNKSIVLQQIKAYNLGNIFDYALGGTENWFEARMAEPDLVLLDMIKVILPFLQLDHTRIWWRNVTSENPGSKPSANKCTDISKPLDLNFPTTSTNYWCSGQSYEVITSTSRKFIASSTCFGSESSAVSFPSFFYTINYVLATTIILFSNFE